MASGIPQALSLLQNGKDEAGDERVSPLWVTLDEGELRDAVPLDQPARQQVVERPSLSEPGIVTFWQIAAASPLKRPVPLSRPLVRDDGVIVVGTAAPMEVGARSSNMNHIAIMQSDISSWSLEAESLWQRPPVFLPIPAPIFDLQWVTGSAAVVAAGSRVSVLHLSWPSPDITPMRNAKNDDDIRQAMPRLHHAEHVAVGGFDRRFRLCDLSTQGSVVQSCKAHGHIASIRWDIDNPNLCTWTTDSGALEVYDARNNRVVRQFLERPNMFAHDLAGVLGFVAGYGDGKIQRIVPAMPTQVEPKQDPVLHAVGDITRHPEGATFLCSGIGGVSLWGANDGLDDIGPLAAMSMDVPEGATGGDVTMPSMEAQWAPGTGDRWAVLTDSSGNIGLLDVTMWREASGLGLPSPDYPLGGGGGSGGGDGGGGRTPTRFLGSQEFDAGLASSGSLQHLLLARRDAEDDDAHTAEHEVWEPVAPRVPLTMSDDSLGFLEGGVLDPALSFGASWDLPADDDSEKGKEGEENGRRG